MHNFLIISKCNCTLSNLLRYYNKYKIPNINSMNTTKSHKIFSTPLFLNVMGPSLILMILFWYIRECHISYCENVITFFCIFNTTLNISPNNDKNSPNNTRFGKTKTNEQNIQQKACLKIKNKNPIIIRIHIMFELFHKNNL